MEEIMKVWTLNELFRLTRVELFGLHREIVTELASAAEDSPEREFALDKMIAAYDRLFGAGKR